MKVINHSKKLVVVFLAIAGLLLFLFSFIKYNNRSSENISTSILFGTYTIDINNINELVGDADYVFAGKVVSLEGYEYKFPVIVENEDGNEIEQSLPYTNYTVKVLKNIKGDLITDNSIPIQKAGGLSQDGSQYVVYEEDELPEVGSSYIFMAYVQEDGSILATGPKSNEKINMMVKANGFTSEDSILKSDEYLKTVDAMKNQVETDRERFKASYEVVK